MGSSENAHSASLFSYLDSVSIQKVSVRSMRRGSRGAIRRVNYLAWFYLERGSSADSDLLRASFFLLTLGHNGGAESAAEVVG
jgi:hypothetical protein